MIKVKIKSPALRMLDFLLYNVYIEKEMIYLRRKTEDIVNKLLEVNKKFCINKRIFKYINKTNSIDDFFDVTKKATNIDDKNISVGTVINVDSIGTVLVSFDFEGIETFELGEKIYPIESSLKSYIKKNKINSIDDFYEFIDQLRITYPYDVGDLKTIEGSTEFLPIADIQKILEFALNINIKSVKYFTQVVAITNKNNELIDSQIYLLNGQTKEINPLNKLTAKEISEIFIDEQLINFILENYKELVANLFLLYSLEKNKK